MRLRTPQFSGYFIDSKNIIFDRHLSLPKDHRYLVDDDCQVFPCFSTVLLLPTTPLPPRSSPIRGRCYPCACTLPLINLFLVLSFCPYNPPYTVHLLNHWLCVPHR